MLQLKGGKKNAKFAFDIMEVILMNKIHNFKLKTFYRNVFRDMKYCFEENGLDVNPDILPLYGMDCYDDGFKCAMILCSGAFILVGGVYFIINKQHKNRKNQNKD